MRRQRPAHAGVGRILRRGPHLQRVDAAKAAGGIDPCAAHRGADPPILLFRVDDQHPRAEREFLQQLDLGGEALPAAGGAEHRHVGVGDAAVIGRVARLHPSGRLARRAYFGHAGRPFSVLAATLAPLTPDAAPCLVSQWLRLRMAAPKWAAGADRNKGPARP